MRERIILLLPLAYNDGRPVPRDVLDAILEELFLAFGGYWIVGAVDGAYRMQDGTKQADRLLQVWIAVEEQDVAQLREMVGRFGALLGQEAMYFERVGSMVEFVEAEPDEGDEP